MYQLISRIVMKRFYTLLVVAALFAVKSLATVPPRHLLLEVRQSDGTQLTIYNVSTPEWSFFRTVDGYLVEKNNKGDYCYAMGMDGDFCVLTPTLAHNPSSRSLTEQQMVSALPKAFTIIEQVEGKDAGNKGKDQP